MACPLGAIANTLFPASSAPEVPITPARTVICPPDGKVGLPASVSVTDSLAALYETLKPERGRRIRSTPVLARLMVTISTW